MGRWGIEEIVGFVDSRREECGDLSGRCEGFQGWDNVFGYEKLMDGRYKGWKDGG